MLILTKVLFITLSGFVMLVLAEDIVQKMTKEDFARLLELLKTYSKNTESGGITRLAYSREDEQAHGYLIDLMATHGLKIRQDAMGNVFARLPGSNPSLPAIGTGSHLDTVPEGGPYDGVLGVIAGLYALLQFKPGELQRDLEVIVFRAEESSRFGLSCIGSKILAGYVDHDKWQQNKDDSGLTLFDGMDKAGYNSQALDSCRLPSDYLDAFVEVHIEQGRCLERAEKSIGIVYGIAAPTRFEIQVNGHADHSGATPMGQRSDALVASADIIKDLHNSACKESGQGTVGTVGKINIFPNSMNVIPGSTQFYVDIRGVEIDSIKRVVSSLHSSINKAQSDNNVEINIRQISNEEPVVLDNAICEVIAGHCAEQNIPSMRLMSGAGHDSMYMAKQFPTAMIFVPSLDGISHHPDEYTKMDDCINAANLLAATLKTLANK